MYAVLHITEPARRTYEKLSSCEHSSKPTEQTPLTGSTTLPKIRRSFGKSRPSGVSYSRTSAHTLAR